MWPGGPHQPGRAGRRLRFQCGRRCHRSPMELGRRGQRAIGKRSKLQRGNTLLDQRHQQYRQRAAGSRHTLALRADGTVWACGNDVDYAAENQPGGVLGAGSIPYGGTNVPIQSLVPTGTVIVAIAAGNYWSLALDTTGQTGAGAIIRIIRSERGPILQHWYRGYPTSSRLLPVGHSIAVRAGQYPMDMGR